MRDFLIRQAFAVVTPLLVGLALPYGMAALKDVSRRVSALPPDAQRAVVALLAGCGNALATFLHVQITGDVTAWSSVDVQTVLSAAIGMAAHAGNVAKANTARVAAAWC